MYVVESGVDYDHMRMKWLLYTTVGAAPIVAIADRMRMHWMWDPTHQIQNAGTDRYSSKRVQYK